MACVADRVSPTTPSQPPLLWFSPCAFLSLRPWHALNFDFIPWDMRHFTKKHSHSIGLAGPQFAANSPHHLSSLTVFLQSSQLSFSFHFNVGRRIELALAQNPTCAGCSLLHDSHKASASPTVLLQLTWEDPRALHHLCAGYLPILRTARILGKSRRRSRRSNRGKFFHLMTTGMVGYQRVRGLKAPGARWCHFGTAHPGRSRLISPIGPARTSHLRRSLVRPADWEAR